MLWLANNVQRFRMGIGDFAKVYTLCRIMQLMSTRFGRRPAAGDPGRSAVVSDGGCWSESELAGGGGGWRSESEDRAPKKKGHPRRWIFACIIPGSPARTLFGCRTVGGK